MSEQQTQVATIPQRQSLVAKFANKYTIEPGQLLGILKATAFKVKDGEVSNEQMAALLVVADQYGLNPFTREIFAFPDSRNGIVPVVSVDGWARIINDHPACDGFEFRLPPGDDAAVPAWMEVILYRKDRSHPTIVREYFAEVKRDTQPWKSHPRRMLRHKVLIQGVRVAFGFSGIYDEDEAERIIERDITTESSVVPERSAGARLRTALQPQGDAQPAGDTTLAPETGSTESASVPPAGDTPKAAPDEKPAKRGKQDDPGTPEILAKLAKRMAEASDREILDLAQDESRLWIWSMSDAEVLTSAYRRRAAELAGK